MCRMLSSDPDTSNWKVNDLAGNTVLFAFQPLGKAGAGGGGNWIPCKKFEKWQGVAFSKWKGEILGELELRFLNLFSTFKD